MAAARVVGRIRVITQKRTSLITQLGSLESALDEGMVDKTNANLRLSRVKDLLHAYEDLHDELAIIDPDNEALTETETIRDRFYTIASRVNNLSGAGVSNAGSMDIGPPMGNSTFLERQKRLKLRGGS